MGFVLVVDDELTFRFFLKALFATEGHEVIACRNAQEGMEQVRRRIPDLITLDVMMPGHGGLEMYMALKGHEEWRHIPVIVLSGVQAKTYAHALAICGAAGAEMAEPYAYVEKPPRAEHLLDLARPCLMHPTDNTTEPEQGE